MEIKIIDGWLSPQLETRVNNALSDGWHLLGPPAYYVPGDQGTGEFYARAAFTLCDEAPYTQWMGGYHPQRVERVG